MEKPKGFKESLKKLPKKITAAAAAIAIVTTPQTKSEGETNHRGMMFGAEKLKNKIVASYENVASKLPGKTASYEEYVAQKSSAAENKTQAAAEVKESEPASASETAPQPAEQIQKKIEKAESLNLSIETFTDYFKDMLKSAIGDKAKLKDMSISTSDGKWGVVAALSAKGFDINVTGDLENKNDDLSLGNTAIDANFMIKKSATEQINPSLQAITPKIKEYLQEKYKDSHPEGIERISIDAGNLKITFKQSAA